MTSEQLADDIIAKPHKVANVYDESTLNEASIDRVGQSICHRLQNYWATNPQSNLTDIAIQAKALLAFQNRSRKQRTTSLPPSTLVRPYYRKLWNMLITTCNVNTDSKSTATRSSRGRSKSPTMMHIQHLGQPSSNPSTALGSSSSIAAVEPNSCDIFCDPSQFPSRRPLQANPHYEHLATICLTNMQKPATNHPPKNQHKPPNNPNSEIHSCGLPGSFPSWLQRTVA